VGLSSLAADRPGAWRHNDLHGDGRQGASDDALQMGCCILPVAINIIATVAKPHDSSHPCCYPCGPRHNRLLEHSFTAWIACSYNDLFPLCPRLILHQGPGRHHGADRLHDRESRDHLLRRLKDHHHYGGGHRCGGDYPGCLCGALSHGAITAYTPNWLHVSRLARFDDDPRRSIPPSCSISKRADAKQKAFSCGLSSWKKGYHDPTI
ncbi:hypothetical protein F5Y18DRAFT_441735, partial [Xylariaceae sp. FL1019]